MSNIINSQNLNINNISKVSQYSFGKQYGIYDEFEVVTLPKFSFDKVLQEKDEFRHQINEEISKQRKKESRKPNKAKLVIAALTGAILLLYGRKKIK